MAIAGRPDDGILGPGDQPNCADGRGRQDALTVGFVIQRNIARHDRHIERRNCLTNALDRADELPHDLGLFGIAEIQVVGGGQRRRTDRGQVAIGFGHRLFAAFDRIGLNIARRHVAGES